MANRNFNRQQALEKEVKTLFATISFDSSGDATLDAGLGISSTVAHTTDGEYVITLQDSYDKLLGLAGVFESATEEDIRIQLDAEDVDGATPTIALFTLTGATATDPADGTKLHLTIHLRNSSVGPV